MVAGREPAGPGPEFDAALVWRELDLELVGKMLAQLLQVNAGPIGRNLRLGLMHF